MGYDQPKLTGCKQQFSGIKIADPITAMSRPYEIEPTLVALWQLLSLNHQSGNYLVEKLVPILTLYKIINLFTYSCIEYIIHLSSHYLSGLLKWH